ncbi:MAG: DnaJ domain-containing protein [Burkholderiaceae bacterium]|nr:DnaJ domain-containing protein [Burkholderiaceae bacterium]
MEFKEYYKTLGVGQSASADEIKKAYRGLARKYHPDVSKEADASARMAEVNEAYAVLSDPEKRAAFDKLAQRRAAGQDFQPPPGWDAGFDFSEAGSPAGNDGDFSDFFNTLFSRAARAQRGQERGGGARAQVRGGDHHARISIDLADAYQGATRPLALRQAQLDESGNVVTADRVLDVQIPKGVKEGQSIRLRGQGSPGLNGGPAGDLYLEINFEPDPRYRIEGRDVAQTLPVAPWEAALGARIEVPTPSGQVEVNVPAGSNNGRKLRLKGRGIPGDPPGDLYLELELASPPANDEKARELYRTMAREFSSFNPRQQMGA